MNCVVESFSSRGSLTHEAKQIRGSLVLAGGCQGVKRGVTAAPSQGLVPALPYSNSTLVSGNPKGSELIDLSLRNFDFWLEALPPKESLTKGLR